MKPWSLGLEDVSWILGAQDHSLLRSIRLRLTHLGTWGLEFHDRGQDIALLVRFGLAGLKPSIL